MSPELDPRDLATLLEIAEHAVRCAVVDHERWLPDLAHLPPSLTRPAAAFVTLQEHGRLRGCIGTLAATTPLAITVAHHAVDAALDDPRFSPVRPSELPSLDVSVSVLSPSVPLDVHGYDQLVAAVQPGVHGVTVTSGRARATLLPSVWDDLPQPEQFLDALWRKAGLPARGWPSGTSVAVYTAQHAARR